MMEQIKNYLSRIQKLDKVIILSSTVEFENLKDWMIGNQKGTTIYQCIDDISTSDKIDAVIFDYNQSDFLKKERLRCRYLIGRVEKNEDSFELWEEYRTEVETIYIDRNKGLKKEEITPYRLNNEILYWEKKEDDVELSVIIPVYNVAEYLSQCIETLTEWKAPYVEYIFVNDGSTDNSTKIIQSYAESDSRIILITKENGGCASARNLGLQEAKGKYIGFVDSDDFIECDMFRKLFSKAITGGYDLSYCGYNEYEEETGKSVPMLNDYLKEPYVEGTWRLDNVQLLAVKTRVAIWRCIYKAELLKANEIKFYEDIKRFDDLPFRIEVLFTAKSVVCVPEYLYYYRVGRIGQDISCRDDRLYVHFKIFDKLDSFIDKRGERKLQDLLQVVKIHTHGYALSRIDKKYKKEYIQLAKKQLNRNMGYIRTLCLILMYTGKSNIGWYMRMMGT